MTHQPPRDTGPVTSAARLSRAEKYAFARQSVISQLRELPAAVKVALRLGSDECALALQAGPPRSDLARRATELAEEVYGPVLLHHCLRCWYIGDLFAQLEKRRHDPELLYIACLLHDIGLTDQYRPTAKDAPCFAVHGGEATRTALRAWGADDNLANTVAEAIAAHLDVTAPPENGIESYLLHAAARLDVVGARLSHLPRSLLREVHTRHPRAAFPSTLSRALAHEARKRPDSRIAVLWHTGIRIPIALNPARSLT